MSDRAVKLEWFTRNIAEMNDKTAAWLITPMLTLMSMDFMRADPSRLTLVDTHVLTGHSADHFLAGNPLPEGILTIPPLQVELHTPEGSRAFLVDGNNRVNILAARGLPRIPVYHIEAAMAERFRFTDEEAVILADETDSPEVRSAKNTILATKAATFQDLAAEATALLAASPFRDMPLPRPLIGLVLPGDLRGVVQRQRNGPIPLGTAHLEQVLRHAGRKLTVNANPANGPIPKAARKVPSWEAAKARKKARK
ncbi:hypothetical protein [Deinococcus kurensis]|uniref:hypothetical protein n=1 Tax=Deinococcus kurensis TaxID=2662757 RepID=UPI0012D3381D|nr:hypothetical protein [Deinococcus kurensis]